MSFFANEKVSLQRLEGVHPSLKRACIILGATADAKFKFKANIGPLTVRTLEQQKQLVKQGKSQTLNSRHVKENNSCKLSCAVDFDILVDGKYDAGMNGGANYKAVFLELSRILHEVDPTLVLEWGGNWKTFKDFAHVQLSKASAP